MLFVQEWAKQTGSYREGVDKPDYSLWKTRLRCALHKAHDIEYIERESQSHTDSLDPYRVYQFKTLIGKRLSRIVCHPQD